MPQARHARRSRLLLAGALTAAVALSGCTATATTSSEGSTAGVDTLVISRSSDPTSFDPAQSVSTSGGLETLTAFYDRLVDLQPDGTVVPALAESWEISEDGLAYEMHLREGVTFHDGSPLTADEVRFTWERIVGMESAAAQYWTNVTDVEVVDELTAVIHLANPDASFLGVLGGQRGIYIGPSRACVAENEATPGDYAADYFVDHECGTGPYELESWKHDEVITFTAYEDHWRGWDGDHVTRVEQRIVPEASTVQLLLSEGDIDLAADNLPIQMIEQLKQQDGVVVDAAETTTIDQIVFNLNEGPTADPRVREAITLLFDYDAAIAQAYAGAATRIGAGLPSTLWPEVTEGFAPVERDVEAAKALLAEAGYPDGFEIDFSYAELNQWGNLAIILQSSLAEGGIQVKSSPSTWPVLFEKLGSAKNYGMAGFQMWAAIPDPNDILLWWTSTTVDVINPGWGDATTDALITGATQTLDQDERVAMYREVIEAMNADIPAIWVDQPMNQTAFRDYVKGYVYNPYYNGLLDFYALSKTA